MRGLPSRLPFYSLVTTFVLTCGIAFAQRDLGSVTGTITDSSGATVASAQVTVANDSTGVATTTKTNDSGTFNVPALQLGTYTVSIEAPGFQRTQQKNVQLNPGIPTDVSVSLQVGNASQTVEVTASAPLLQTESPAIGEVLNERQVSELPLGGQRTFTFLARLTPGVVPS